MKEKIERFSRGDFEYELPLLQFSEEEIELTVEAGKIHEGSFTISNSAGRRMKGFLYSSNRLMQPMEEEYDAAEQTIAYQFDAANLKAGDEICGQFHVISEFGESSLPFCIRIEASYCMSSMGKLKDLFQFTNLARIDWSDAKRVFKSEDFERVFLTGEARYRLVYRNLIKSISTSQAMEEFLVIIRKKQAVRLEIDRTQVEYQLADEKLTDKLTLTKNQWGYAEIRVSTDIPFIQLEQKFLWSDRFTGNTHQIAYSIDPALLRRGNNYGHILIRTPHQLLTISVCCRYKGTEHRGMPNRHKQKIEIGLMETYLSFRINRIRLAEYIDDTQALIAKLPGPEVSYLKDLMKTHLAIISGRDKLAQELLSDFARDEGLLKNKSILEYCAYLYLEALLRKDETLIENNAAIIRNYYSNGYHDWRILWFLLYTDKRYEKNKTAKLADIKEQFQMGCRSPILYYEAVCVINEEPYLLRELSDFEVQALNYGIKNWIISKEAAKQYTYLAGKRKTFVPVIFHGLVKLYDEFDSKEILSAICCLLIKGMKRSLQYFEWYRLGVEAQLRITELYEYYMYSAPDSVQEKLAQAVLIYFIYNNTLSDSRKAFLYAGVVKSKYMGETIYNSYYKQMEVFALRMLGDHEISRDLAVLYQDILSKPVLSTEIYQHLPYVMYRNELICRNPNMVGAVVIHKELEAPQQVTLIDGRTLVDIYTSNSEIFLLDSYGNRYADSVEYQVTPLMNTAEYESTCVEYSKHPMLLLHLFDRYHSYRILSESAIELRRKVLLIEGLKDEYVSYCHQTLIEYYYENLDDELLEYYLSELNLSKVTPQERTRYIEIMLIRTYYQKALEALETYGFEGIPINRLVRLCSVWMKTKAAEKRLDSMVKLCFYVFRHEKYDESILRYLINFYHGSIHDMYRLWEAAQGFEVECHNLEERLLSQMLFAESDIEDSFLVFHNYYKTVTNHLLVRALLSYYAYRYLVRNQAIDTGLFQIMKRELFYEENDCCLLAWLKYHARESSLNENELIFTEYNIHRLVRKGIILPFFSDYKHMVALPEQIADQYIISCQANPGKRIYIHYRQGESSEFETECMRNCFLGIYIKEFLLFWHEELEYYITEEPAEETGQEEKQETRLTDHIKLRYEGEIPPMEALPLIEEGNYQHINRMLVEMEAGEDNTLFDLLETYARREHMIKQCFKPMS